MNRIALMILRNIWKLPGAYWKLRRYAKHRERYSETETYRHIQYIMKLAVKAGNIDLQVFGKENLPEEDGFILYSNHQGLFDVMALAATCDHALGAVYKKELSNTPFLKTVFACTKSFAMDREDVRQSLTVIRQVTEEVLAGRNYAIFPEGTRSKNGNALGEFHAGSFRAAMKAKCPIVPVALADSYKVLDEKGSSPVTVKIHYLPPIAYEEYGNMKSVELAQLVKERIEKSVAEHTV